MGTLMRPANEQIARAVGKKLPTYEVRGHFLNGRIRIHVHDPNTHAFYFTKLYASFDSFVRDWITVE